MNCAVLGSRNSFCSFNKQVVPSSGVSLLCISSVHFVSLVVQSSGGGSILRLFTEVKVAIQQWRNITLKKKKSIKIFTLEKASEYTWSSKSTQACYAESNV